MGIFHSAPARSGEGINNQASQAHEARNLGPHGPTLVQRRNRRLNWWEVLKLGAVTVSVGALQVRLLSVSCSVLGAN